MGQFQQKKHKNTKHKNTQNTKKTHKNKSIPKTHDPDKNWPEVGFSW